MGWFSNIHHPFVSLLLFPLEIHKIPTIIDNNFPHQGIVKRKLAKSAIACLPPEEIDEGGSGEYKNPMDGIIISK